MNYHEDDRAQRLLNVFPIDGVGQVNLTYVNTIVIASVLSAIE